MEAKEFLIANPLLNCDVEKYIWIDSFGRGQESAQRLFVFLMKKNIYINGFVTDETSLIGLKMYHKTIFDIRTLDSEHLKVFYEQDYTAPDKNVNVTRHRGRIVNPEIGKENVFIWGAGITGETVYKILKENEIQIKGFVDSNHKLKNQTKYGLPIYMPEQIEQRTESITIIEALEKWKALDCDIKDKYEKRFYFCLENASWFNIIYEDNGVEHKVLSLVDFYMFNRFTDKRIYVYGNGRVEREFIRYLKLMEFDFAGVLVDESDEMIDDDNSEYPVEYVEEILYETDFYIWVYEKKRIKKLMDMGLKCFIEFESANFDWNTVAGRQNPLDLNFGYGYQTDSKYAGITVYGREEESDYKIAVLGSSTSDGALYAFPSWPQLLYEEFGKSGVTIYNGGVCGYVSGQELFKLIRDILPLKPDMILVYDGYSDLYTDTKHPFAFQYAQTVFEYAEKHIEDGFVNGNVNGILLGMESEEDRMGNWLANIRSMYAIAAERNIKFFSFLQPCLSDKEGKTEEEKNMLLSMPGGFRSDMIKASFNDSFDEMPDKPDYIYDLSHIFDGESDIYMDVCHVWEKGNRIIARRVKEIISSDIKKFY